MSVTTPAVPEVSIVVLSCNRKADILQNLPKLAGWAAQSGNEVIVVDNASTDGSPDALRRIQQEHPALQLVLNEDNKGVGGGRNCGFRLAKGSFIVCLDDDSDPDLAFLNGLGQTFEHYPKAGIVTPKIVHAVDGHLQNPHGGIPCWVANFHGCCHAIRREVFEKAGLLDEGCDFGGEEIDFSIRAHKAGFLCLYHPGTVCRHNSFTRQPEEQRRRWGRWVYNYARVLGKNFPPAMATRLANQYTAQFALKLVRAGQSDEAKKLRLMGAQGLQAGLALNEPCPSETVAFYSNPKLEPEFGNVGIARKVARKLVGSSPDPSLVAQPKQG